MRLLFTGGGTAGHILPNIAVHDVLAKTAHNLSYNATYIGSPDGPEQGIAEQHGIKFYPISCGKLRRYFSWKNFLMPFQTFAGFLQTLQILRKVRPDIVFSKGGFVSVPVVLAAWISGIPVILHESDISPGLANRICARFSRVICVSWPETLAFFPHASGARALVTGIPIREKILHGNREKGFALTGFDGKKPVLLVMGGSLGAESLNRLIIEMLPKLLRIYDVAHLTGYGKNTAGGDGFDIFLQRKNLEKNYKTFEYLDEDLAHIYAISDVIVSRAGASAIAEISALKKCAIYIPLGTDSSRGDQIQNVQKMEEIGGGIMIHESEKNKLEKILFDLVDDEKKRALMAARAYEFGAKCVRATDTIVDLILDLSNSK